MAAIFVHLSDIHFGQERDERIHIHTDVKEQLIADAAQVVRDLLGSVAHGILVTGDIAYSGTKDQYDAAGKWLDTLAEAIGCEPYRIQMIPGNHDVDREKESQGCNYLLDLIRKGNASDFEKVLGNDQDRASLFARFEDYGRFCEGYDCPLDVEGRYSTNLRVEIGSHRAIRFVRMNSSLLCTGKESDEEPELMVGARQFIVPRTNGEEVVVLLHHPLNWFKDSVDATTYLRSRARVLITGHEHNPKAKVDPVEEGADLLLLAAGATVPFKSNETYTFTYNIIEFDWDSDKDALAVTIHPRAWNPARTCFEADEKRLGGKDPNYVLASPNFRKGRHPKKETESADFHREEENELPLIEIVAALDSETEPPVPPDSEGYRFALLRFFRDLSGNERLRILAELGAFEEEDNQRMTQAVERRLFDWLVKQERLADIERLMAPYISSRKED
jgi:predicted MPP superfamily phosphohydrolase